jgi:hypothetical protein
MQDERSRAGAAMIRAYGASGCRPGNNPLRVGVIAVGNIFYLQDQAYFRSRYPQAPVCKTPWIVEAFLNEQLGASSCDPNTGHWRSSLWSGRNDTAVVRSLRDGRRLTVTTHILQVHEDHGLTHGFNGYPSLPDLRLYRTRSRQPRPLVLNPA